MGSRIGTLLYVNAGKERVLSESVENCWTECVSAFLQQLIIRFSLESIYSICEDREIDEEKCQFVVEFCATAFVGKLVVWAEKGMKEDPRPFVRQMKEIVDGQRAAFPIWRFP